MRNLEWVRNNLIILLIILVGTELNAIFIRKVFHFNMIPPIIPRVHSSNQSGRTDRELSNAEDGSYASVHLPSPIKRVEGMEGLVHYYPFDGHADDRVSGVEAFVDGPTIAQGIRGQGYRFASFDDNIELGVDQLDLEKGSLSLWFSLDEYGGDSSKLFCMLTQLSAEAKKVFYGNRRHFERFEIFVEKKQLHVTMGVDNRLLENLAPIELKRWYNVIVVWEHSFCTIYLDAKRVGACEYTHLVNKSSFIIGNMLQIPNRRRPVLGIIDEIKIWDRAIDPFVVENEFLRTLSVR